MPIYSVLPTYHIPQVYLSYMSSEVLEVGQVVNVPIRTSIYPAIVYGIDHNNFDTDKIKPISSVEPWKLSQPGRAFLEQFAYTSFNHHAYVLKALLQPFETMTKQATQRYIPPQNTKLLLRHINVEFHVETDILFRIIYLIRNNIYTKKNSSSSSSIILILFYEKKALDIALSRFKEIIKQELPPQSYTIYTYTGSKDASSKQTVRDLLTNSFSHDTVQIIFALRSGLFLPFYSLSTIIVTEEWNSFYIQEQNQLYYDTRDAAYILANAYNADIHYISSVPSVRLHNFYSEKISDTNIYKYTNKDTKHAKIEIMDFNPKTAHLPLISAPLENRLSSLLDDDYEYEIIVAED